METATVTLEGDHQTVRLPKSVHLPATVFVRQEGETVVLEPAKPKTWPEGFFDSVHVTDPAFERPERVRSPVPEKIVLPGCEGQRQQDADSADGQMQSAHCGLPNES